MKTETKEVYSCDFCKKKYFHKGYAMQHENMCTRNPENERPCFDCNNLVKKETEIYYDFWDGEHSRKVDLFYCKAKEIFLYTPQNEMKGNAFDLGDDCNEPMPKECKDYDNNFNFMEL